MCVALLPDNTKFTGEDQALRNDYATLMQKVQESKGTQTESIETQKKPEEIEKEPKEIHSELASDGSGDEMWYEGKSGGKEGKSRSLSISSDEFSSSGGEEAWYEEKTEEDDVKVGRPSRLWREIASIAALLDRSLLKMVIEWLNSHSKYYVFLEEKWKHQDRQAPKPTSSTTVSVTSESSGDEALVEDTEVPGGCPDDSYIDYAPAGPHYELLKDKEEIQKEIKRRLMDLLKAVYYAMLANTHYICYLLIVLNATVNGSILSLVYVALMFLWGLLSIPWPTKRFWLTLMFYNMSVILVKYGFQFQQVDWSGSPESGLYWPRVLGVEKKDNFLKSAIWDIMLLVSLFFHRYYMKVGDVPILVKLNLYEGFDSHSHTDTYKQTNNCNALTV